MRRFLFTIIAMMAVTVGWAITVKEVPFVYSQDSTKFVSNPNGILSSATVAQLNATIRQAWRQSSCEFLVAVVDQTDPEDIDQFATELFEAWGLGKKDKDNGVLMVVAKDQRQAIIRTGYGVEGILPDITCWHILDQDMFPDFKEGNYDAGVTAGVDQVCKILTDPEYAAEVQSKYANHKKATQDDDDFWVWLAWWLVIAMGVTLLAILYFWCIYFSNKKTPALGYNKLKTFSVPMAVLSALGLGIPLLGYVRLHNLMRRLRNTTRKCPHCGTDMVKQDEEHDNYYLNTGQDMEEQLNSVDYDVWLCPKCGEKDVIPFDNPDSPYVKCPTCGAKTARLESVRVLRPATTQQEGEEAYIYHCEHCRNNHQKRRTIPKKADPAAAAAAGLIIGSMLGGGGGRSGGGGFGGGFTGGGRTGGGGASGGW